MSGLLSVDLPGTPEPGLLHAILASPVPDFRPGGYQCNAGGPMSRLRKQELKFTLLGKGHDGLRCPRVMGAALDFDSLDPLRVVERVLKKCGFQAAEEAASVLMPRMGPCICRESELVRAIDVRSAPPETVLRTALILGHATQFFFDPARPLVWTRSSLQRRLQLFSPSRFYQA